MTKSLKTFQMGGVRLFTLATALFFAATLFADAATANPFKKVAGAWRSAGATAIIKGNKEKIKCRAKYSVPGKSVILNLKCSGPGYYINVNVDARVIGSKVNGSWSETQFGKSGSLSGRASSKHSNLSFVGSGVKGVMSLALSSSTRHYISIRANGNKVSIPLRR